MKGNNYLTPHRLADGRLLVHLTEQGATLLHNINRNPQHDEVSAWIELTEGSDLELLLAGHLGRPDTGLIYLATGKQHDGQSIGSGLTPEEKVLVTAAVEKFQDALGRGVILSESAQATWQDAWSYPASDAITDLLRDSILLMDSCTSPEVLQAGRLSGIIYDTIEAIVTVLPLLKAKDFTGLYGYEQGARYALHYGEHGLLGLWAKLPAEHGLLLANHILQTYQHHVNGLSARQ